jgi:hypothetical protein
MKKKDFLFICKRRMGIFADCIRQNFYV